MCIRDSPYSTRRTIYGYIDRLNIPEVYNQFDFANPENTMGKRYETIVPQQSLFLMNSPLVIEQARNLVDRPDFQSLTNDEMCIRDRRRMISATNPKRPAILNCWIIWPLASWPMAGRSKSCTA